MGLTELFFSFRGRINRAQFWMASILLTIAILIAEANWDPDSIFGAIFLFTWMWSAIAVQVKRWHDRNKSGWWVCINMVPYLGQIWMFVELGFLPSINENNQFDQSYGSSTKDTEQTRKAYNYNRSNQSDPVEKDYFELNPNMKELISMLSKFAKCDGRISEEEIKLVNDFFVQILKLADSDRKKGIQIFEKAKTSDESFETHAINLYRLHATDKEFLNAVIDLFLQLALVDGQFSAEEDILLAELESIFNFPNSSYSKFKEQFKRTEQNQRTKKEEYLEVLGLKESYSIKELKNKYKRLAAQYHPDKVEHLGPKLRDLAEEEMKKINEAYTFLLNLKTSV